MCIPLYWAAEFYVANSWDFSKKCQFLDMQTRTKRNLKDLQLYLQQKKVLQSVSRREVE